MKIKSIGWDIFIVFININKVCSAFKTNRNRLMKMRLELNKNKNKKMVK